MGTRQIEVEKMNANVCVFLGSLEAQERLNGTLSGMASAAW